MIDIETLWNFELRRGNTDHPRNGACLMDAARWIVYREIGDDPECACPVIRAYAIRINDTLPDDERQRLKQFILRVVGNRDPENEMARAEYLVKQTADMIVPIALEAEAAALRGPVSETEIATISATRGAVAALYWAEANVGADWENADTEAAGYAARAAVAASDAAGSASAKQQVYDAAIEMLDGVLSIGKQVSPFDAGEVCLAIHAFGRARKIGCAVA